MRKQFPLIALAAVLIGCDDDTVTPPEAQTSPILAFADESETGGTSSLTRTANGIQFSLDATGLDPETGVSLWIVVFNEPQNCDGPCDDPDLFKEDVNADVLNSFAGEAIGSSGSATFTGTRAVGDSNGSMLGALGLPAPGILDTETAEIHFVLRSHGELISGMEQEQTQTFNGGCQHPGDDFPDPLPESLGAPGPNTCVDVQFAAHQPY